LREEHRLRVFENKTLRRTFDLRRARFWGSGQYDITTSFMICLLTKFYSDEKSRTMRWAGHVARMGDRRGAYRVLVGES